MTRSSKTKTKAKSPVSTDLLELAPICTIPLSKLTFGEANVRKTNPAMSIEALAKSIARRSLLQSLSVRTELDADGAETGNYVVQAGQRRLRALRLLVEQGRLDADAPIPCLMKTGGLAEDDSLAENSDREALHPLDQFRAFATLREKNMPEDDIAAAYGVTPTVVKQRLKLAAASSTLLEAYAADELTLEQLMAFCITDDHVRQDTLWEAIALGQVSRSPHAIRRLLTESSVRADDQRALFVGIDAYMQAGGPVTRDLFSEAQDEYLDDPALLTRLMSDKLEQLRQSLLAAGWKWVEAAVELPYSATSGMRRLSYEQAPLSHEEQQLLDELTAECEEIEETYSDLDEAPVDIRQRMRELQDAIHLFELRPPLLDKEAIKRAGVMVDLDYEGRPNIRYGLVRPEDELRQTEGSVSPSDRLNLDDAGDQAAPPAEDEETGTTLPDRLVQDLTSYRTIALRDAMAENFEIAFLAVLHTMCLKHFDYHGSKSCLQIDVRNHFANTAPGLSEMTAATNVDARHETWQNWMPETADGLWEALVTLAPDARANLFAHCASLTINAVRSSHQADKEALRHADHLACALQLDMLEAGWTPTVENYFGRITKAHILEAVREAKGDRAAQLIDHLKKPEMAKEAQRLVATIDDRKDKIAEGGGVGMKPVEYNLGFFGVDEKRIALSHDDIPRFMAQLLGHPKFRDLLTQQYPVIFIDEYQDTDQHFMTAISKYFFQTSAGPLIGLFGDHWQTIYRSDFDLADFPIKGIDKKSNFRSAPSIVNVLNKLRPELPQEVSDPHAHGEARFFHANSYQGERTNTPHSKNDLPDTIARDCMASLRVRLEKDGWDLSPAKTKVLMLTHSALAAEQGYPSITTIFKRSEAFAKKEDATIEFFADTIEPMCRAYAERRYGAMFKILGGAPPIKAHADKLSWRESMEKLNRLRSEGTIGDVIDHLKACRRPQLSDRVMRREEELALLNGAPVPDDASQLARHRQLREVPYSEVVELVKFVERNTMFATQHSVKGAEFENVLVVLGGGWNHYNWPQLLELLQTGAINKKNTMGFHRTRNLFYVSISRPKKRLAVLATQTLSPTALKAAAKLFGDENVHALELVE